MDPRVRFNQIGLTSQLATAMMAALSKAAGRALPPTLVWECPSIAELARRLAHPGHGTGSARPSSGPTQSPEAHEPVAVVGLACRFPDASSPAEFWERLCTGHFAVGPIPGERWDVSSHYHPDPDRPGKMNTRWGGFIKDVDRFEPLFFGISPREAEHMDPQQRLALKLAWESLEDAGMPPRALKDRPVGVYMGVIWHDYADLLSRDPSRINLHTGTGTANSLVANRISYTFGLTGPSMVVDTACSSSLVAIHLACQSIRSGESEAALAGGVSLMINPVTMVSLAKFGGVSSNDRCRAFDAKADGFVRGEGAGIMVLKPLSRALADGDRIYSLIRGSAQNNDGASNGLTAPNPKAQIAVLRRAYQTANLSPSSVSYVEAHGAGTVLGDPIEAVALGAVLGNGQRPADRPLLIGSVKTNLGHLEGAAGVAGAMKTALSLYHEKIPPSLHFETPNPGIPFEAQNIEVVKKLRNWPQPESAAIAGISSFGWGGTNCHLVMEGPANDRVCLLALQASSAKELAQRAEQWRDRAGAEPKATGLAVITPDNGRAACHDARHRLAFVARPDQIGPGLSAFLRKKPPPGLIASVSAKPRKWVFVFSPQGGFYRGMGQALLRSEPAFRTKVRQFDRELKRWADFSVLDELAASPSLPEWERVDRIQPLTVAMHLGLAAVFSAKGIIPSTVIGHSLGEISAAHVAGILSLGDAAHIIAVYSKLQATTDREGGMAIIGLTERKLRARLRSLGNRVAIAAWNGPQSMVVSGDRQPLNDLVRSLTDEGIFARRVKVNVAAHSARMDPILAEMSRALAGIRPRRGALPMFSTLTEDWVSGEELNAEYWPQNLRRPVRFAQGVTRLAKRPETAFLELSPHPILSAGIENGWGKSKQPKPVVCPLRQGTPEQQALCEGVARIFCLDSGLHLPNLQNTDPLAPISTGNRSEAAFILPISAHNRGALRARIQSGRAFLAANPGLEARELAAALARRWAHHDLRLAMASGDRESLLSEMDTYLQNGQAKATVHGRKSDDLEGKIAFLFPGQGSQWSGMARHLFLTEPVFTESMKRIDGLLQEEWDHDLIPMLMEKGDPSYLEDVAQVQPLLFSIQVSLAALWRSWGIVPNAVLGHSMGETAAAYAADSLSLEEAVAIICRRSRLMARTSGKGAMLAVELSERQAEALISPHAGEICIAVCNSPRSTVLTGARAPLEALRAGLEEREIYCRWVKVNLASHGPQMDPILEELRAELASIRGRSPNCDYYSSVLGEMLAKPDFGGEYWVRNLREPVRFGQAVSQLMADGYDTFLEISPHPILLHAVEQTATASGKRVNLIESMRRDEHDGQTMMLSLGRLYCLGHSVDWHGVYPSEGRWLDLPSYPWRESRFWAAPSFSADSLAERSELPAHPYLGRFHQSALRPESVFWQRDLNASDIFFLEDHCINGAVVMPAAVFVAWAIAAYRQTMSELPAQLLGLRFDLALVLERDRRRNLQTALEPGPRQGDFEFAVSSLGGESKTGSWQRHASGRMVSKAAEPMAFEEAATVKARCTRHLGAGAFYEAARSRGTEYGPCFQAVEELWVGEGEALGRIDWPPAIRDREAFLLHPVLLDACLHMLLGCFIDPAGGQENRATYVTVGMDRVSIEGRLSGPVWSHARIDKLEAGGERVSASVSIVSQDRKPLILIEGIHLKRLDHEDRNGEQETPGQTSGILESLSTADDAAARQAMLLDFVAGQAAAVLKLEASAIDPHQPLHSMGLSSLMTLELRNRLEAPLRLSLSATLVWNYPTIAKMAGFLAGKIIAPASRPKTARSEKADATTAPDGQDVGELEQALFRELDELEALLKP